MSHIFKENVQIPIPYDSYVNPTTQQVFVKFRTDRSSSKPERVVIGRAVSDTHMFPNSNFKDLFPHDWEDCCHNKGFKTKLSAGVYAATLSVGWTTCLYPLLYKNLGPKACNALMDFGQGCMVRESSTAMTLASDMAYHLSYSKDWPDDSVLSRLFCHDISIDQIDDFKGDWLRHCAQDLNITKAWLSIDGSNNDCAIVNSHYAEPGKAKSNKDGNIFSFTYAISSNGTPIDYIVTPGSKPDCKAIHEIISELAAANIECEGILLDRGYDNSEVLQLLADLKLKVIVKLKSSTYGFTEMVKRHGDELRFNFPFLLRGAKGRAGIFGTTDQVKLFNNSEDEYCVGLYFDSGNYSPRLLDFFNKLLDEMERIEEAISKMEERGQYNSSAIKVSTKVKDCIRIITDDDGKLVAQFDNAKCQQIINQKGYTAIASSDVRTAQEIFDIYSTRDISEKQFAALKTFINGHTTRVHSDHALEVRMFAYFIVLIIRTKLENICKILDYDFTKILSKLSNDIYIKYLPNDYYLSIKGFPESVKKFLAQLGLEENDFEAFACERNELIHNKNYYPLRMLPAAALARIKKMEQGDSADTDEQSLRQEAETKAGLTPITKRGRGRPKGSKNKKTQERVPKRSPGRPKGSKNKKTLEREAAERAAAEAAAQAPKRRGRPKGSKNKKTLEREAAERAAAEAAAQAPKRRGRPKGSKNKKTLEREVAERAAAEAAAQAPKRRGRPKGSKNKKTLEHEAAERAAAEAAAQAPKRRGRPKKNKKTLEREAAERAAAEAAAQAPKRRGRPKGSKNKKTLEREAAERAAAEAATQAPKRRGRPKSKNKETLKYENADEKQTQTFIVDGWLITWTTPK